MLLGEASDRRAARGPSLFKAGGIEHGDGRLLNTMVAEGCLARAGLRTARAGLSFPRWEPQRWCEALIQLLITHKESPVPLLRSE